MRPSFQIPLPSGPDDPGVLPSNADTPAAVKLPETQGIIASPLFQLPPPSAPDHQPLFQLPPSTPKSQQDGMQCLFNVPTVSTLCNVVAAELNTNNMAMVQDTNIGKEENLPPSPFQIPSPNLRMEAQPKLRYLLGLDPSISEFMELLTELASNLSTPAGIL